MNLTASLSRRSLLAAGLTGIAAMASQRAFAATRLSYWHHLTSPSEFDGLKRVLDCLAAAEPDLALAPEAIPNADFMAKFATAILARGGPETTMVVSERVDDMLALGALRDLSPRLDTWPGRADLPPDRWRGVSRTGGVYGVPAYAFVDWMYYRLDWFEEAGLDGPPATFEAFAQAARRLTDPAKGRFGFGLRGGAGGAKYVVDVMEAFGSPPLRDGAYAFDRAAAREAVGFYAGLFRDGLAPPTAAADGYLQVMDAFRAGRTAMVWHHTGSLREVSASLAPGRAFSTAPVPAGPKAHVARVSYACNAVTTRADDPEAAWRWVRFWAEPAPARAFHEATGFLPASASLAEAVTAQNPIYRPAVETLAFGRPPPAFAGYPGWASTVVLPAFQGVLVGNTTIADAVDDMARGLDAVLK
jgi:multiple sugar transport system substrate-binding protein